MSYLACGSILLTVSSREIKEAVARSASIRALETGMALQLGCNIVQPLVFEVVGRYNEDTCVVPFLLTASPLDDTSDRLVSPYVLIGEEGDRTFQRNAKSLELFFSSLLDHKYLQRIDLYVVDSFDESFETRSIQVANLEQELMAAWNKREREFFFRLVLPKIALSE
jgi:hypothetical protein